MSGIDSLTEGRHPRGRSGIKAILLYGVSGDGYLRVNVGRDSRDCAINRGMFTGTAQQSMEVCARMTEI